MKGIDNEGVNESTKAKNGDRNMLRENKRKNNFVYHHFHLTLMIGERKKH